MGSPNRLKLGLFGANCSSGRAVTTVPERWSGSWPDCVKLAQLADEAGIEFMLPIGRWKGYGGYTDYQGSTWETVTWACGLLAKTQRLIVFGTVHALLIPPLVARQRAFLVTAPASAATLLPRWHIPMVRLHSLQRRIATSDRHFWTLAVVLYMFYDSPVG